MTSKTHIRLACICVAGILAGTVQAAEWKGLINGTDLSGWQQLGGTALYEVDGDTIVGHTVADSPNSFLTTKKHYSDFILEYEMLVEAGMNSGVQIRSHVRENGVVFG